MTYGKQDASSVEAKALRKKAGAYLKEKRLRAGLTQRQVALACDFGYYTQVSQMECGDARVPPRSYEVYAHTVGVPTKQFVRVLLKHYDPHTHKALFGANKKDT